MRQLDPIRATRRFANGFFYTLADDLDENETTQVATDETDRMRFFQTHWPDLYTWLMLNSNEEHWSLYHRGMYPQVCFILAIYFDDALYFNSAFNDRIEFVDIL
jgi:hypothetical protein